VRLLCAAVLALAIGVAAPSGSASQADTPPPLALLDRYAAGDFDQALADLRVGKDFETLWTALRDNGQRWIDGGPPADRARRRLAAATFALEAARLDEWRAWKKIVRPPLMEVVIGASPMNPGGAKDSFQPLNALFWSPAPMLLEWGCQRMRESGAGDVNERRWQLAAIGVAERSEDAQFLVGDQRRGLGYKAGEIVNEQTEIRHLDHARTRFPAETRFQLAEGIARYRDWPDDAAKAFTALEDDPAVGAEALIRNGQLWLERQVFDEAYARFDRGEHMTRDPYLMYLAAYLRGLGYSRQRIVVKAEAAWRQALRYWPKGQSASIALATLLAHQDRHAEARRVIVDAGISEVPTPDPWREFAHGDDRFFPELIARLRREIKP
jgi:tetratricopeptide (TPR) repeat protein